MKSDKNPIVYITRERERAGSKKEDTSYSILDGKGSKSTLQLLQESDLPKDSSIVVFKNNVQIEKIAEEKGLNLLNPSAVLAEKIENKISQVVWLGDLSKYLPNHKIQIVKNITFDGKPFILQWAHSHTGDGTLFIKNEKELNKVKVKFPEREARISEYIKGPMFTQNIIVGKEEILFGNMSYQITGILPFTENPFSTIGNDWSLPPTLLTPAHMEFIGEMAKKIAEKFQHDGWKGLFGIDVIYDEERDQIFLIEINARQPASTTFESQLQDEVRKEGVQGITVFEAHLEALQEKRFSGNIIEINDGAQIIQRVTKDITKEIDITKLAHAGYKVIKYNNTKINSDLLRIQSKKGIMETHTKFNKRGKQILELL